MSAITGICDFLAMAGSASASSVSGTATRTIWQPEAVSSAICCKVAFTSAVLVVHIDWTDTGWSLPTQTPPTLSCRVGRRGASTGTARSAGRDGIPRPIISLLPSNFSSGGPTWLAEQLDGIHHVGHEGQHGEPDEQQCHHVGDRHQFGNVERAGIGL